MKKIAAVIFLFILIVGCEKEHLTKPTLNNSEAEIQIDNQNKTVKPSEIQDEIHTITDIEQWDHPVKDLFVQEQIKVSHIVLSKNRTYPAFYVTMPKDFNPRNENYYGRILDKIAKANGYWDYSIRDDQHHLNIEVVCDKNTNTILRIIINGKSQKLFIFATDDELLKKQEPLMKKKLISLNEQNWFLKQLLETDLDQDGHKEYIVSFGESKETGTMDEFNLDSYVLQKTDNGYTNLLELDRWHGAGISNVELIQLDQSGKTYIYAERTNGFSGSGFDLYELQKGGIVQVDGGFPPTGSGYRFIEKEKDGTYRKKTGERFSLTQDHVLKVEYVWNGAEFVEINRYFDYFLAPFSYPSTSEKVVQNYIEDSKLKEFKTDDPILSKEMAGFVNKETVMQFNLAQYGLIQSNYESSDLEEQRIVDEKSKVILEIKTKLDQKPAKLYFSLFLVDEKWRIGAISTMKP